MKLPRTFFCLILLLPLLGCEELNDLTSQEIDIPISAFFNIQVAVPFDPDPESNSFNAQQRFILNEDPVISNTVDNLEDIKKMRIELIQYEFRDYEGEFDIVANGEMFIIPNEGVLYNYVVPGIDVAQADFDNTTFELEGDYAGVENFLGPDKGFSVGYRGTTSGNPSLFTMRVTVSGVVTVEVDTDNL